MNKKLLLGIIILQLIVIIIISKRNKDHLNYEKVQKMVDSLSLKTKQEILTGRYLLTLNAKRFQIISEGLDQIEKLEEFKSYTQKVPFDEYDKRLINYLLYDFESFNKQERQLVISIIKYLSFKSIEKLNFESYFHFESIYIQPSSIRNRINFGESYEVFLPICGKNELQSSILVLDGDTVQTQGYLNYYSEKPKAIGKVKHSGYLIVKFVNKEELRLPVNFEYTVINKE